MTQTDAFPKTLDISVTKADIRKGTPRNCILCPVAQAIHRSLQKWNPKRTVYARVYDEHIEVQQYGLGMRHVEFTPPIAKFVKAFDSERSKKRTALVPFTTTITLEEL